MADEPFAAAMRRHRVRVTASVRQKIRASGSHPDRPGKTGHGLSGTLLATVPPPSSAAGGHPVAPLDQSSPRGYV